MRAFGVGERIDVNSPKTLYIIAGPNGAGKTTASYTLLPEIFACKEFVNADEIARGLSPFDPDRVKVMAGRLMLERIDELMARGETFAFETTLSTRSYVSLVRKAQAMGYEVTLLFLWLNSVELAMKRVKARVAEGGHNIAEDVIKRRYENGLRNFFNLYSPVVDSWLLVDNSEDELQSIAKGAMGETFILNHKKWHLLNNLYHGS